MISVIVENFSDWRIQARQLLEKNLEPAEIIWSDSSSKQPNLFDDDEPVVVNGDLNNKFLIPKLFLQVATMVSYHRDHAKWDKLYTLLWRITHGERNLLAISSEPLVHDLLIMQKAVSREAHKMKAFVRFCKFNEKDGSEYYLAWYKPEHLVLRLVAPFFQRRFAVMRWTVMTPEETVHWDGNELNYSEGKNLVDNPTDDLEHLWQTYYKAIFNPARIKIKAMKKEMPTRYWHNLPETKMIPSLLKEAPQRLAEMMRHQDGFKNAVADYFPETVDSLVTLKEYAKNCRGCPLYANATQTVFGSGNPHAKLILVGEQPGDQEDLKGLPFIGPAGQVLINILQLLGIKLEDIYLTNAVKHFKFRENNGHRTHRSPDIREIDACKPWVLSEIRLIKPKVVLCLGLSAAKSLINPSFRIKHERGQFKTHENYLMGATFHPSAILRANNELKESMLANFKEDIERAYSLSKESIPAAIPDK